MAPPGVRDQPRLNRNLQAVDSSHSGEHCLELQHALAASAVACMASCSASEQNAASQGAGAEGAQQGVDGQAAALMAAYNLMCAWGEPFGRSCNARRAAAVGTATLTLHPPTIRCKLPLSAFVRPTSHLILSPAVCAHPAAD